MSAPSTQLTRLAEETELLAAIDAEPDNPALRHGLAQWYLKTRKPQLAIQVYEKLLDKCPTDPDALSNMAMLALEGKRRDLARTYLERLVAAHPEHPVGLYNLGVLYQRGSYYEASLGFLLRAAAVSPDDHRVHNLLGNVYQALSRLDEAESAYREALRLQPDFAEPHCSLGVLYKAQNRDADAEREYEAAASLRPDFPEVYYNWGNLFKSQHRYAEAEAMFQRAIAQRPDYIDAQWNLGIILLSVGRWTEAWQYYDTRLTAEYFVKSKTIPMWQGEPIDGKRIMIGSEQGFGDVFQSLRYLPEVKARGGYVMLECKDPLREILSTCPYIDELIPTRSFEKPGIQFDTYCYMMSLPKIFGSTPETVPSARGMLVVPDDVNARWREKLAGYNGLKVGITWTGNPGNPYNVERAVPFALIRELAEIPGLTLFSLQKDGGLSTQNNTQDDPGQLVDLAPDLTNFLETAGAINALDFVISIDTVITHLAGCLEKPVWLLLPRIPDWRWLLEVETSPWYENLRIFRQGEDKRWEPVMERLKTALEEHLNPPA